jgi:hypothetical protein
MCSWIGLVDVVFLVYVLGIFGLFWFGWFFIDVLCVICGKRGFLVIDLSIRGVSGVWGRMSNTALSYEKSVIELENQFRNRGRNKCLKAFRSFPESK